MEPPPPLGAGKLLGGAGPIHLRYALKLEQVPDLEVHEQQGRSGFSSQIAERVEIPVAAKIGDC
jgi:hypothetical protein